MTDWGIFMLDHLGFRLTERNIVDAPARRAAGANPFSLLLILDHLGFRLPEYEVVELERTEALRKAA
jgi:hypothetical protein